MTVVWWVQGADRERALTALPAAKPSRAQTALRFCRRRGEGSTGSTPLVGRSGGGGRRRGAGQPRGRARVARRRAAGVVLATNVIRADGVRLDPVIDLLRFVSGLAADLVRRRVELEIGRASCRERV